jgi:hypothetical protein
MSTRNRLSHKEYNASNRHKAGHESSTIFSSYYVHDWHVIVNAGMDEIMGYSLPASRHAAALFFRSRREPSYHPLMSCGWTCP